MRVTVALLTYDRAEYAERTLRAMLDHLTVGDEHTLALHIADDGTETPGYRERLLEVAAGYQEKLIRVTVSNSERRGYGGNYNEMTRIVHELSDVVLPLEDDWEMQRAFCLDPLLAALGTGEVGCIRLGYLGWTQELRGAMRFWADHRYLLFDPRSPEPHVFSGHPRLETVGWERDLGVWPEHMTAGATEFTVAHRPNARHGVAWPVDFVHPRGDLFAHIGTVKAEDPSDAMLYQGVG